MVQVPTAESVLRKMKPKVIPGIKTDDSPDFIIPNNSGDHVRGLKREVPVNDYDIANKKYVDDNAGGNVNADNNLTDLMIIQGDGGAKKIKTSTVALADVNTVVTAGPCDVDANLSAAAQTAIGHDHTQGTDQGLDTGGANAVTAAEAKTAYTHSQDNTQAHSDYLLNSGADEAAGPLTITADNSSADTVYVPMVLYNTDATPPAANTVPVGTIYIQYTV